MTCNMMVDSKSFQQHTRHYYITAASHPLIRDISLLSCAKISVST